jgi:hypothetical protein
MLRRIAMLIVFGATFTVAASFVVWYQRFQPVPSVSHYTIPCEQEVTAAWCGALQRTF